MSETGSASVGPRSHVTQSMNMGNQDKPNVIDMNTNIDFPSNKIRKKNKNDFYRFLL